MDSPWLQVADVLCTVGSLFHFIVKNLFFCGELFDVEPCEAGGSVSKK